MNKAQFSNLKPEDQARYMRAVLAIPGACSRIEAQTRAWTNKAQSKGWTARIDEQTAAEIAFWAEVERQELAQRSADRSNRFDRPVTKSGSKVKGSAKRAGAVTGPGPTNGPKIDVHVEQKWSSVPGSPLSNPARPWAHTNLPVTGENPYLAQFRAKVRSLV